MRSFTLVDKASLSRLRRSIRAELRRAHVPAAAAFDCLVAVTQICAGAFDFSEDGSQVTVSWELENGRARFVIECPAEDGALERDRSLRDLVDDLETRLDGTLRVVSFEKSLIA